MTEQINNTTYNNSVYYLSSIVDGKEERTLFKAVLTTNFEKNKPIIAASEVQSEEIKKYYVANYIRFSDITTKDETEIIKSEVAELFNISIPKVHKIYNQKEEQGIVMNTNLRSVPVSLASQFSKYNYTIQNGQFKNGFKEYSIPPNKTGDAIVDSEKIKMIIQKGLNAIPTMSITDPNGIEKLKSEYIRMILLDLILNQTTRNGSDYYFYESQENKKDGTVVSNIHVLPGILNYNFVSNEYKENEYALNDFVIDRKALLEVLFNDYYKYIRDVVKPLRDVSERYKNCISRILYNNTSKETAEYLENLYTGRIDDICKLEQSKVEEGNKVELVKTTTLLYLTIQKKETEIYDKYPKNPKEEYDNPMLDIDERLSLKAEISRDNDRRNGYVSAILISTTISFVCGLGIGIAYIIMNLS